MKRPQPTQQERRFDESEIIVSKTDLKGRLTYVNDVFCKVGLYTESELIGQPHSIVRHPDMPRAIFSLLWSRIKAGEEIFAYVKNMAKNGDHYWVFAHVTPSFGPDGKIEGYHSNRRVPSRAAIQNIEPLYRKLLEIEAVPDRQAGMREALQHLQDLLQRQNRTYDEYIFSF